MFSLYSALCGVFSLFCFIIFLLLGERGGLLFDFVFCSIGRFDVRLVFLFDWVSLLFYGFISFICGFVFLYRFFYMGEDWLIYRFSSLVFLFYLSMFFLVFGGNFFVTMVGWDGLGVTSFFLVVFYQNFSSGVSGLITVYTNRLGDAFFLISFFWFLCNGYWRYDRLFFGFVLLSFLILLGCFTKRAQVPFSAWLPAAMRAPTPVSSLVHSSTLVTAGVYVLVRYNLLVFCGFWVGVLSVFTVFLSGFVSFFEFDLKKLVAISTLSQLGVMSYGLFVGMWKFAFLHMLVHALFKAVLFLSVGSLITSVGGRQDFVLFGFEWYFFSYFIFFCRGLCLCGFPFFIGFYSKDFILWGGSFFCLFLWVVFLVGCLFTVFYVFRLYRLVFSKVLSTGCFLVGHFSFFLFFNFLFFWLGFVFFGGFVFWLVLGSILYWIDGLVLLFGVFLLGLGFLFVFMIYIFFLVFVKLGFLYYISGRGFSSFIRWIRLFVFGDYTWMEEVGAQGVFFHLDLFGKMVGNVLMVITFFGTMSAFFFVLVVFVFV